MSRRSIEDWRQNNSPGSNGVGMFDADAAGRDCTGRSRCDRNRCGESFDCGPGVRPATARSTRVDGTGDQSVSDLRKIAIGEIGLSATALRPGPCSGAVASDPQLVVPLTTGTVARNSSETEPANIWSNSGSLPPLRVTSRASNSSGLYITVLVFRSILPTAFSPVCPCTDIQTSCFGVIDRVTDSVRFCVYGVARSGA